MNHAYTIMIVDDIEYSRSLVEAVLLSAGYHIVLANNGEDALTQLSPQIDLLIIDALMPKMSGFQLVEKLRQDKKYKDIPVLMATGLTEKRHLMRAYEIGVDAMITKPFDRITLLMNVRGLTKQRKAYLKATQCKQTIKETLGKLQQEHLSPESQQLIEKILEHIQ